MIIVSLLLGALWVLYIGGVYSFEGAHSFARKHYIRFILAAGFGLAHVAASAQLFWLMWKAINP